MARSVAIITLVALVCAAVLGGVYLQTAQRIDANRTEAAWQVAFDLAGGVFEVEGLALPIDSLTVRDRLLTGITAAGYGGDIQLLVAFEGSRIGGLRVLRHEETPGLGDFIEGAWLQQFVHQPPETVDTVTGATITSRAVIRALTARLKTHVHDNRSTAP